MRRERERERKTHLDTPSFVLNSCDFYAAVVGVVGNVEIRHDAFHLGLHDFSLRLPLTASDGEVLGHLVAGVSCLQ